MKDFSRKDLARFWIADAAEKIALSANDWETGIYTTHRHQSRLNTQLVSEALGMLSGSKSKDQPTLDELTVAAREWYSNCSLPSPTDVPF